MKKIISVNFNFATALVFALVFAFVLIAAGCGKMKEDFERGRDVGRRQAQPNAEPTPILLSADSLRDERLTELGIQLWTYKPGDDASRALPEIDDADWEVLMPVTMNNFAPPKSGWNGIGWFRLRLDVDDSLADQQLGLMMSHPGASEVYIDGKLMQSFGTVSADPSAERTSNPRLMPFGIVLPPGKKHLIAVRYSNTQAERFPGEPPAFGMRLAALNPNIAEFTRNTALIKSVRGGTFGICLALGLLHLLLFLLYPRQLGNLFYSLFLLSESVSIAVFEVFSENGMYATILTGVFVGTIYFTSFLAYLYTVLEQRLPRYLRVTAGLWLLSLVLMIGSCLGLGLLVSMVLFTLGFLIFLGVMIWNIVSVSIVIIRAVRRKVDNSLILGIVGASFIASSLSSTILSIVFGQNSPYLFIGQFVCLTALIIANAVFLARQFARTSRDLETQLVKEIEHEKEKARLLIVEAENERRAQELEEARLLQLSMLPKKLPKIANLEIAAYMKPASEVGGDYYDFYVGTDGTLTVAVGDATGHGLKAGSVVTATKSLFNAFAGQENIPQILTQTSGALKKMNLRGLFMALTLMRLKDDVLSICAAGMPSTLVYRAGSQTVEEINIRALPLGSMVNFKYEQQEILLGAGDCVIVMSDGFPEMFNPAGEMLGFNKAAEILPGVASRSAAEIVENFVRIGEDWAGTRPADDDVTFVVLKVTG